MNQITLRDKINGIVFTNRCAFCGEVVEFDAVLCEECATAKHIEQPLCLRCGASKKECRCKRQRRKPEYKAICAPFYYEGSIARAVLNFKMQEIPALAPAQGREIALAVRRNYKDVSFDYATFVPMMKADKRRRGFNQAELLAEAVAGYLDIPCRAMVYKRRRTKMQKRQSGTDRFVNMYNAFAPLKNADIDGKTILLIDDVKTTGSTLSSVALTLNAYGAKAVYCATFAITK